jgi:hypothetical protein
VLRRALAVGLAAASAVAGPATAAPWGGPQQTSSGESVTVLVSDSYPVDPAVPKRWAEWAATKLPHADGDLADVRFVLLTPVEVAGACVAPVDGCYLLAEHTIVGPAENYRDGTNVATVLAHEFAHHLSTRRLNPPWSAFFYGPKRWATAVRACPRVRAGTASAGDTGGGLYGLDVAEAWAETYAHAVWRTSTWEGGWWPAWPWYLHSSFAPTPRTLNLAVLDAAEPWRPVERIWSGKLAAGRAARMGISPLDGALAARLASGPAGARVALYAGERLLAGPARRLAFTVCGQKALNVRLTSPRSGAFSLAIR